jgi:hypothetical protein
VACLRVRPAARLCLSPRRASSQAVPPRSPASPAGRGSRCPSSLRSWRGRVAPTQPSDECPPAVDESRACGAGRAAKRSPVRARLPPPSFPPLISTFCLRRGALAAPGKRPKSSKSPRFSRGPTSDRRLGAWNARRGAAVLCKRVPRQRSHPSLQLIGHRFGDFAHTHRSSRHAATTGDTPVNLQR